MNKELIRLYRIARLSGCKASRALTQARIWVKAHGSSTKKIILTED